MAALVRDEVTGDDVARRFDVRGKVVVITGSGRGLGRTLALGFGRAGASVVVCSRTLDESRAVQAANVDAGGTAVAQRIDVGDPDSCAALVDDVVAGLGRIDVLVNNAGVAARQATEDVSDREWDAIVDVNLRGSFLCARQVARSMLARGAGGSIVNVSSASSLVGLRGVAAYAAAKAGVNQMTKVMAVEWASRGIRVNAVVPGYLANVMPGVRASSTGDDSDDPVAATIPLGRRAALDELVGP